MTIVAIIEGGLGNQMFGYAYARALALKENTELFLDSSSIGKHRTPRTYQLDVFNIKATHLQPGMEVENPQVINGYYMGEKFFEGYEDRIRQDFTLAYDEERNFQAKTGLLGFFKAVISEGESVSLTIRRGDYVSDPIANEYHGTCSLEYYNKAIEYIASKIEIPVFLLFSDDIEWVKQNVYLKYKYAFISNRGYADYEELVLISRCNHHIISNSSFGWWGAWLGHNPNKIVCSPKQWTKRSVDHLDHIFPPSWVLL